MANVIKHKRGSGSDPVASDLVVGEVAIRTDVGKLFTKMDNGSVAEIAGGGSDIAINTLSSSSGTGGGSATFNGSAYRFTLSQPPNVSAAQLLVSINGVIQKPVAGTGQPSEGFSVDGTDIILGDAPATGSDFFILTFKSLGVSEPADNSVTSAKIVDGAIVNADINASAAIAGTKISPDFGSQDITTSGEIEITGTTTVLKFTENDNNPDFGFLGNGGLLRIQDLTNTSNIIVFGPNNVQCVKNLDLDNGLDVTGAITGTGNLTIDTNTLHVDSSNNRVGIGTTSPEDLLHIKSGKIRIENTIVSNNDSTISYDNTDFIIDVDPNNARGSSKFQVKVDNVAGLTVDDNRNVNIGDTQMSQNLLNIEDGTAAVIDIASHGSGGDTAYIGVKKSTGGGLTFGISNRDIIFKTGATYNNGTSFNSGTEALRIHANRRVSIGTDSADASLHIKSPDGSNSRLILEQTQDAANYQNGIDFKNNGTQYAGITAGKDSSNNSLGLVFHTGSSFTERFQIKDNGHIKITSGNLEFASGSGIDFSASSNNSGMSSELLDDYEEGRFTPSYTVGSGGGNMVNNATYNATGGSYTKVGRLVLFSLRIQLNSGFTVIGGHVVINGLPFTSVNEGHGSQSGATFGYRAALGTNNVELHIPSGQTQIQFYSDQGTTYYAGAGGNNFANTLHIWGTYHAA